MFTFEDLASKITEKSPSRARAKGKKLGKVGNLTMREQALKYCQNQKVSLKVR